MNTNELTIDRLTYGGRGIGRLNGMAVFVPGTLPGDRVRVSLCKQKKRYAEAELLEILEPGPGRRQPLCPVVNRCGGCQWQHLEYSLQCQAKEEIFHDMMQRQAGVDPSVIRPLVPAPDEWGYRSRAQLKAIWDGTLRLGFFEPGSHTLVDFERCPVLAPVLNIVLGRLRKILPDWTAVDRLTRLDLNQDDRDQVRVVLYLETAATSEERIQLEDLWQGQAAGLLVADERGGHMTRICGNPLLDILPQGEGGLVLQYGPGGFAQINLAQNRALVSDLLSILSPVGDLKVLDLYCGMGNFSLPLAQLGASVTGVEVSEDAIEQATKNALNAGLDCCFVSEDVATYLAGSDVPQELDLILLDPPRRGAAEILEQVIALLPDRIVYVSCDPATLVRDLQHLVSSVYSVRQTQAYDLFPQTYHIESLTLLERA